MARRIQSCIGFDKDNLEWLKEQEESMADWINRMIKIYREDEKTREKIEESPIAIEERKKQELSKRENPVKRRDEDDRQKIRAYLLENDHIVYMAKTQRRHTRKDLCKIKDEMYFSKYNIETTVDLIREVLKEMMADFDVKEYEKKKGIVP